MVRAISRIRTLASAFLVAFIGTTAAGAQGWPAGGIVAGVGISSIDGKGATAITGGMTRSWGPVVGTLLGDLSITTYGNRYPAPNVDLLTAQLYCGTRPSSNANTVCPAEIAAVGGGVAEIGLALGPLVLSRGYRFTPVSEAYFSATLHGSTSKAAVRWIARAAVGPRMNVFAGGIVIDFESGRP